jgi:hypothetical protein
MATPVYLKSSSVASKVPSTSSLSLRELGVNTTDGILYLRQGTGVAGDIVIPVNPWRPSTGNTTAYNTYFTAGNVGIGTTNPTQSLHVVGNSRVTGIRYDSNNLPGSSGQVLTSTGSGTSWSNLSGYTSNRTITYQTATAGQTTFTVNYSSGNLDVFLNGSKLQNTSDYTATDGSTIVLAVGAVAGDILEFISYNISVLSTNYGTLSNSVTTTSTTQTTLLSASASSYRSIEYIVQATQGSNYKVNKIIIIHDGTNVYLMEYSNVLIGSDISTYDANISGGNINLLVTPSTSSSTTFRVVATAINI